MEEYSGGGESVMISSHVLSCCCGCCCCLREEFNLWLSKLFNRRSVCVCELTKILGEDEKDDLKLMYEE